MPIRAVLQTDQMWNSDTATSRHQPSRTCVLISRPSDGAMHPCCWLLDKSRLSCRLQLPLSHTPFVPRAGHQSSESAFPPSRPVRSCSRWSDSSQPARRFRLCGTCRLNPEIALLTVYHSRSQNEFYFIGGPSVHCDAGHRRRGQPRNAADGSLLSTCQPALYVAQFLHHLGDILSVLPFAVSKSLSLQL